ncbi:MAG: type III pantothenate kinase [Mycoplasmataceae bacterium]|nr:type III pantothenate kinase [Mycoplasmataceae bacterium]
MNLYIDIGNTNIKITYGNKTIRFLSKNEYTSDSLFSMFPDDLKNLKIVGAFGSSVVKHQRQTIENIINNHYMSDIRWLEAPIKTGIKIEADDPKTVGADLIALSAYAASRSDKTIIINLGTATTYTYVNNNTLKGVIISPGIMTQYNSLVNNASLLHEVEINPVNKSYGKNSRDAISIGIINATAEAIKGLVNKIDKDALVIMSGGNSRIFKSLLDYEVVDEATTKGLMIIKELNDK